MSRKTYIAISALLAVSIIVYVSYEHITGFVASPSFKVSAGFETVIINYWSGNGNSTMITLKSIKGFEGNITLEIRKSMGYPIWLETTLEPLEVFLPANEQVQIMLTLFVRNTIPAEDYSIFIECEGDDIQRSLRIDIQAK